MTKTSASSLFSHLRVDPNKAAAGVWVTHPETHDRFRLRRLWGPEHISAYLAAIEQHNAEHGEKAHETDDGKLATEATALATAVVIDWKLAGNAKRKYDPDAMAAALVDPELSELRSWLRVQAADRTLFRPDAAKANA